MNDLFCISNNCFSGFLYQNMGIQYNHPFVWCRVNECNVLNMLLRWETIDWTNIVVAEDQTRHVPCVNVQGFLPIIYPHYLYSESDTTPRTTVLETNGAVNVRYNKPMEYAKEKYLSRVSRMPKTLPAIVIVHDFFTPECSDDETLLKIADICNTKHIKLFTISCKRPFMHLTNTEYVRWIDLSTPFPILPEMVKTYKDDLLSFIGCT